MFRPLHPFESPMSRETLQTLCSNRPGIRFVHVHLPEGMGVLTLWEQSKPMEIGLHSHGDL